MSDTQAGHGRLTMPDYRPRLAETDISSALSRVGAVLIDGARACGKTWTARRFARSEARVDDPAVQLLAESAPATVLAAPLPACSTSGSMPRHCGTESAESATTGPSRANSS